MFSFVSMRKLVASTICAAALLASASAANAVGITNFNLNLEGINSPFWTGFAEFEATTEVDPNVTGPQSIDIQLVSMNLTSLGPITTSGGEMYDAVFTLAATPAAQTFNIEFNVPDPTGFLSIDSFFDVLVQIEYFVTGTTDSVGTVSSADIDIQLAFSPQDFVFLAVNPGGDPLELDFTDNDPLYLEVNGPFPSLSSGGTMDMPEPATTAILGLGFLAMAALRRRRETKHA